MSAALFPGDPGSVHRRQNYQTFTSAALESKLVNPIYVKLSWKAAVPADTSLKFQLRSSATKAGLHGATWYGAKSKSDYYVASSSVGSFAVNMVHNGDAFIQYRATLGHDLGNTPVLDRLEITYR